MERRNSFGMTWADQWDTNGDQPTSTTAAGGAAQGKGKYAKMVGDGMKKAKEGTADGMKKVKEGTASGLKWMKDLCAKTTQKH
ncbi:hypothetical protein EJ110_NYTH25858 [Nymphaea thermarum]|nr:hypothetical protein EJ110_NYTH25858 [Nymphaea thermarum]